MASPSLTGAEPWKDVGVLVNDRPRAQSPSTLVVTDSWKSRAFSAADPYSVPFIRAAPNTRIQFLELDVDSVNCGIRDKCAVGVVSE